MKKNYRTSEEGDIGIATLILFIAIIIVAAIASSLIIYVGVTLREQGEKVAADAVSQITSSLRVLNILGDRDTDGMDSNIISVRTPIHMDQNAPTDGFIKNVTVYQTNPLSVKIEWSSATDSVSGMGKEVIYRINSDYATLKYVLNNINYVETTGKVVAVLTSNFTDNRYFIDYTVEPDQIYGYAIIGYDKAGNGALYNAINQTVSVPSGTKDVTPPTGSITSIKESGFGVLISWTATDTGSGLNKQIIYRSREPISSGNLNNTTQVAILNGSERSYMDYPPSIGTWYYAIVGTDNAGNSALYSATSDSVNITIADIYKPTSVRDLHVETTQYSVVLYWNAASDNESGIKGYYIYRSQDYMQLTTPELFNSKSYAFVTNTSFEDFKYIPFQTYYYAVIAVDNAGNPSELIYPQSSIQVLQIKLALGPGSQPVDFNTVIVEITDGAIDASLKLNSSGFGVNASDKTHYSMSVVNDPSGEFRNSFILSQGAVVKMYINARDVGLTLTPQTTVQMKIIIGSGVPIYKEIIIPAIMLNRFVQIY